MLKCRDIARQASDYLDGNQTLSQRLAVALHLLICGNCKQFIRHLRIALAYYRRLPSPPLGDAAAAAIADHAISQQHQHPE